MGADERVEAPSAGVVNLYSSRHYDTDLALYEDFRAQTGIKVNRIEAGADALIERIKAEGEFSPADLLITVDAGRLWRAEQAGILAPVSSPVLNAAIPDNLRNPDGLWFGLSKRARIIIYNKAAGRPVGLRDYEDLANPSLNGKVCIRSSSNIYNTSLLASLISHLGADAALDWAKGVVANFARKPQGNDIAHIRAVASGECGVGLVNTYYLARLIGSDKPEDQALAAKVGVIFPNQGGFTGVGRGTHVNISGAGLVASAPNRANAVAFLEYLTSASAQAYFANGNNEYPVVEGVAPASAVSKMGAFEEDTISAGELGRNQAAAVRLFDQAGWQ
ncbi:MAG: Fe(3+) ABC transporter substrate-binding protein [Pseudomonadota bacterium]